MKKQGENEKKCFENLPGKEHMPSMDPATKERFVADLVQCGCRQPIEVWGDYVVDGWERYTVCTEKNITFEINTREFNNIEEALRHAISVNLLRRHLNKFQRVKLCISLLQELRQNAAANQAARSKSEGECHVDATIAEIAGVGQSTASRALKILLDMDTAKKVCGPQTEQRLESGESTINSIYKKLQAHKKRDESRSSAIRNAAKYSDTKAVLTINSKFQDALSQIDQGSVAAIITDPPYGDRFPDGKRHNFFSNGGFYDLAKFANKVLCDGGHLICMCPQDHLPEIHDQFRKAGLSYNWEIAQMYLRAQGTAKINSKDIECAWKPILWYRKGKACKNNHWKTVRDIVSASNDPWDIVWGEKDKSVDLWQQSLEVFRKLIATFTVENAIVCDPCLGAAATTAVAAIETGRKIIGIECDRINFDAAKGRIAIAQSKAASGLPTCKGCAHVAKKNCRKHLAL